MLAPLTPASRWHHTVLVPARPWDRNTYSTLKLKPHNSNRLALGLGALGAWASASPSRPPSGGGTVFGIWPVRVLDGACGLPSKRPLLVRLGSARPPCSLARHDHKIGAGPKSEHGRRINPLPRDCTNGPASLSPCRWLAQQLPADLSLALAQLRAVGIGSGKRRRSKLPAGKRPARGVRGLRLCASCETLGVQMYGCGPGLWLRRCWRRACALPFGLRIRLCVRLCVHLGGHDLRERAWRPSRRPNSCTAWEILFLSG